MKNILKEYLWPRFVVDFISFLPVLMIFGIIAARLEVNGFVLLGILVNYLLLIFSFGFNDIEDREDDRGVKYAYLPFMKHIYLSLGWYKKDGYKRFKNPFAWDIISPKTGYIILTLVALVSMAISYHVGGIPVLLVAFANIFLGIIYSGGYLRLKGKPVVDLISHSLLLAAVQVIYFLAYPEVNIDIYSIMIVIGVTISSAGGALENQYRDFKEDMDADLHNTASLLGRDLTKKFSVTLVALGAILSVIGAGFILLG